jgi:predicted N-acyltransferase
MTTCHPATPIQVTTIAGVGTVPAPAWDALVDGDDPFLEHAFLVALEASGSVGPGTGWEPRIVLAHREGRLVGAVPLYLKHDSMAEFIWDFAWAHGALRAGLPYYPKLVAAIPFTPAASHRLLVHPEEERGRVVPALIAGLRRAADDNGASSIHVLYCRPEEVDELTPAGFMPRASFQLHWSNRTPEPYRDFADFLADFRSRQRKQVRHERKVVDGHGLRIEVAPGPELDDRAWTALDRCYRATVYAYGNIDFLTPDFFVRIRRTHAQRLLAAIAYHDGEPVAAAMAFMRDGRLCGRYWGSVVPLPMLHFELCYYRLVEYAIAHGLARVEGGAGGAQKLKRGFLPARTYSAHWIRHAGLCRAVAGYLQAEREAIDEEMRLALAASPFARHAAARESGG